MRAAHRRGWYRFPVYCGVALAMAAKPSFLVAQDSDSVFLTAALVVSVQPGNDLRASQYRSPEVLGAWGPGFSVGVKGGKGPFAATAEFSMGRIVKRRSPAHTWRLHDSMLTGLIGAQTELGASVAHFLGGVSILLDEPTFEHRPISSDDVTRLVPTAGFDPAKPVRGRTGVFPTARLYLLISRTRSAEQLGVGSSAFRAGVGVRVALN